MGAGESVVVQRFQHPRLLPPGESLERRLPVRAVVHGRGLGFDPDLLCVDEGQGVLAGIAEFLPGTPLTRNQIALMEQDNVASADLPGLPELSVTPTAVEAIVLQIAGRRPG